ncbi:MAG: PKD domain-containing protein, partial [Candidatus Thermoplasmatota archaeon]|nr:PKD domain-containing protein [Candidatus Thermoplasmatota archaeon]
MKTRNSSMTVTAIVLLLMLGTMVVTPSQNLRAQEDTVVVYGWVFDDMNGDGVWDEPLESGLDDVQVDLHDVSSMDPVSMDTFGGGYFEFEISQPSYYLIQIESPGKQLEEGRVFFGNETVIVRVHDENQDMGHIGLKSRDMNATIRGAVTDGMDGLPINDATVTLRDTMNDFEISQVTAPIHEYENRRDKWMISPEIPIPDVLNIRLRFRHWYRMENGQDGGNIQVSTDSGGSWNVLDPLGGYPNPSVVEGQPGFTGVAGSDTFFESVSADLTDYAGETIQFAFRFTSDTTTIEEGWYIDLILIEAAGETIWSDDAEIGNQRGWTFQPVGDPWQISDHRHHSTSPTHSWYCGLDIEGWYSMETYDGEYEIEVSHLDYSPTFQTVIVSPNNIIGNLKHTNVIPASETLYLNDVPITAPDYQIDYLNGTVSFFLTIDVTDIITADYAYTVPVMDETLTFGALGNEIGGTLSNGNIDIGSYDLYLDGALWPPANYVLDNVTGVVTYNVTIAPGSLIWANYTPGGGTPVEYEVLTNTSTLAWPPVFGTLRIWINIPEVFSFVYNANGEVWFTQPVYVFDVVNASYVALHTVVDEKVQLAGGTRADLELFKYTISGRARRADGGTGISDRPIHAALYDASNGRVITSTASTGPEFSIGAYPGEFYVVTRIDGYKTVTLPSVTVIDSSVPIYDQYFEVSEEERVYTNISFDDNDWNIINVDTAWKLNSESYLGGMDCSELHNVRMQIDIVLGNGDGTLDLLEIADFITWIDAKGPRYVVTDQFFLIDGNEFVSDHDSNSVTVTLSAGPVESTEPFWVRTSAQYNTSGIESGLDEYKLTQYVEYDTSIMDQTEKNRTYSIDLPTQDDERYEMVENETISGIHVAGFLTIRIDPPQGSGGPVSVDMTVRPSVGGVAKIEVIDPLDRVSIPQDITYEDYNATVPAELNITFSAATSIDNSTSTKLVSPHANFTWIFDTSNPGQSTRYGIEAIYNYTTGNTYTVNLTISESGLDPGGDISYREATIFVDELDPSAVVSVNITSIDWAMDNANGQTIDVNESMAIKFDSVESTDLMYGSTEGKIKDWKWDLEGDGIWDRFVSSFTYSYGSPGNYTVNLTVADSVGHWSSNATVDFIVHDISPPSARIILLNDTYIPTTSAIENKTYYFNASESADNHDDLDNLTFDWDFGDGTVIAAQLGNYNVSHVFTIIDTYNVTVNATDRAGNAGNSTLTVKVIADASSRPDLEVLSATFYSEPKSVEEGQSIKLSVNVTNKQNHATADSISVDFYLKEGDKETKIGGTVRFYNESGLIPTGQVKIEAGETIRAEISLTPEVVG